MEARPRRFPATAAAGALVALLAAVAAPAGAGVFEVPTTGVNNDLTAGLGTLVWRHDYDVVKFDPNVTPHYETLLPGFDWRGFQSAAQVGATFFFSDTTTLWKSDGTAGGTVAVRSLPATWENNVTWMRDLGGTLFFRGYTADERFEPWVSDGTDGGTRLVADLNPGGASGMGEWGAAHGGRAYFDGEDGVNGVEPWVSDGTAAGTFMLKDVNPAGSSSPASFLPCGSYLYFVADDGVNGRSLWRTDGTGGGTLRVTTGVEPQGYDLTCVGTKVFFDDAVSDALWFYDPVDGTTPRLLKSDWGCAVGAACGPSLHTFRAVGELLLFAATDGAHGEELWKSDGSPEGTVLVKDIWPGLDYTLATPAPRSSAPYDMEVLDGKVYFRASHPDFGSEVWVSDGVAENTWPITDVRPGPADTWPRDLTAAGGRLFFRDQFQDNYGVWGFDPFDTPPFRDLLSDGSFEEPAGVGWATLRLTPFVDQRVCNQRLLERCSFKIAGAAGRAKSLRQVVYANGTDRGAAGQVIALSGWSKAIGASAAGGFYGLEFVVSYTDGTRETRRVSFTRATHPWQYRRAALRTAKQWGSVAVFVRYLSQAGAAWFDDVRLTVR